MFELASVLLNLSLSTPNPDQNLEEPQSVRIAHSVKVSNGVGATIHIDPDDRPVAGQNSKVWISLSKRGGVIIPYESCNCNIEVQSLTDSSIRFILPKPTYTNEDRLGLHNYVGVVFPQAGRYNLRVVGESKEGAFEPFELNFPVDVSNQ